MPDPTDDTDPFLHALQQSIRPEVLDRAGRKLAEVVAAVAELEKKGRLTLELTLAPMKNNTGAAEVSVRIKASIPEAMPAAKFMWPDEHGRLHRNDPRQQELPGIRVIDHLGDTNHG
jgi:hypothetical protein